MNVDIITRHYGVEEAPSLPEVQLVLQDTLPPLQLGERIVAMQVIRHCNASVECVPCVCCIVLQEISKVGLYEECQQEGRQVVSLQLTPTDPEYHRWRMEDYLVQLFTKVGLKVVSARFKDVTSDPKQFIIFT